MKITTKNTFLRFFAALCIIALMLVITAGKCKPKGGNNNDKAEKEEDKKDCTAGFKVTMAEDSFKDAFTVGTFVKDSDGSFNADMTVDVAELTRDNGFVSNHVWINNREDIAAAPFDDAGVYQFWTPTWTKNKLEAGYNTAGGADITAVESKWIGATTTNDNQKNQDLIFCGYGGLDRFFYHINSMWYDSATKGALATARKAKAGGLIYDEEFSAIKSDTDNWPAVVNDSYDTAGVAKSPVAQICKDVVIHGGITQADGFIFQGIIETVGMTNSADKGERFTQKVWKDDKEGASWLRRNGNPRYTEDASAEEGRRGNTRDLAEKATIPAATLVAGAKKAAVIARANDTDRLYDEVVNFFSSGGKAMASLSDVFAGGSNLGIVEKFNEQPKGSGATGTTDFAMSADGKGDFIGTSERGGWQKVFTITPCEDKIYTNGFAVVQDLASESDVTSFKSTPHVIYDGDSTFDATFAKNVHVRAGTDATDTKANNTAVLMESVPGDEYNGNDKTGFFTVRHTTETAALTDTLNAATTKGVLVCRSAMALTGSTEQSAHLTAIMGGTTSATDLAGTAYAHTVQGYKDGEVKDDNKGLGMTCYLGLSALWPDAVDGADKLSKTDATKGIHTKQFEDDDQKVAGKYDVSSKTLGIVMVSVDKETTIQDDLMKPFLITPYTTGGSKKLEKTAGTSALTAIKTAGSSSKVKFLYGVMTVKFEAGDLK